MLKVEIESAEVKKLQGTSKKSGNPYSFQTQEAWIWTIDSNTKQPNRHPQKIELMLDDNQVPYSVGFYELDLSSIYVSRQQRLSVSPRLAPVKMPQRTVA